MSNQISWSSLKQQIFVHKRSLIVAQVLALCAVLVNVPIPLLMPVIVDEVLLKQPANAVALMNNVLPTQWQTATGYILCVLLAVCVLRIFVLALSVVQSRLFITIGKRVSLSIREKLLNHLARVKIKDYETLGAASVSSRCVVDVESLDDFLSRSLSSFLINFLTVIGIAAILLWLDWVLGLLLLLLNPAMVILARALGRKLTALKSKENSAFEVFQGALVETLEAIHQLRAAQREGDYFHRIKNAAAELAQAATHSQWRSDATNQTSFTLYLVGFEVFRAATMLMVVFSDLSVGHMLAVFSYLWFMMGPVQELLHLQFSYNQANGALQRLNELLRLDCETVPTKTVDPFNAQPNADIAFINVGFSYNEETPLLKNINLTIPAGKKVAIVSVSGGGKSTLVHLLLGLYEKDCGEILINGVPIERVGYPCIRQHVTTVLQTPVLFNSSVRANLTMGKDTVSDTELWRSLAIAELKSTIEKLPAGLDAEIGRGGIRLSGGQKQRLAIARMVLCNPKVVILDEATSALDSQTEATIHNNLLTFLAKRTTIIIAHRLSAIRHADIIYVMDDGNIIQSGSHQSLVAEHGLYKTLYQHQHQQIDV